MRNAREWLYQYNHFSPFFFSTGGIPGSIGSPTLLKYLDLSYNKLTGAHAGVVVIKYSVIHVQPPFDFFSTGNIPRSIGSLTLLAFLDLSYNQLSGVHAGVVVPVRPPWLAPPNLRPFCSIGTIPESLGNLSNLQQLRLDNN